MSQANRNDYWGTLKHKKGKKKTQTKHSQNKNKKTKNKKVKKIKQLIITYLLNK